MAASKTVTAKPAKTGAKPAPDAWDWDEMIAEFRALGGIADNVKRDEGKFGKGLFAIDPTTPVSIVVPKNLLFRIRDIEFTDDGVLQIKADSDEVGEREKAFFKRYHAAFDWGDAREDLESFIRQMDALPQDVRDYLVTHFEFKDTFSGDVAVRARSRFLQTRMIAWKEFFVIFPVMELVNHAAAAPGFTVKDEAIEIGGTFADEIYVRYNVADPMGVFANWGFVSEELIAFSVKMGLKTGATQIMINRDLRKKTLVGDFLAPSVTREGDVVNLSYLMIGNGRYPRLSKGLFYRLMRDLGMEAQAEELFDHILHHNRTLFFNFLAVLENHEGPTITMLRRLCRHQLEAMSYSLGVREI
jgi:hypothetical protein